MPAPPLTSAVPPASAWFENGSHAMCSTPITRAQSAMNRPVVPVTRPVRSTPPPTRTAFVSAAVASSQFANWKGGAPSSVDGLRCSGWLTRSGS